ncbi:MAG: DNA-directed RNA polymerase subunit omega [Deferribacterota bacterium]|nr:DNA-directed RNA polymerase subunit omega [Deferribacterota bacterium]
MPLIDVEKAINNEKFGSKFKLTHIASLRAREIHNGGEDVVPCQVDMFSKSITKALYELVEGLIDFVEVNENEEGEL